MHLWALVRALQVQQERPRKPRQLHKDVGRVLLCPEFPIIHTARQIVGPNCRPWLNQGDIVVTTSPSMAVITYADGPSRTGGSDLQQRRP